MTTLAALLEAGAALGIFAAVLALILQRVHALVPAVDTTDNQRIDAINALLPQTQCGYCGHAGCRPYAEAMAAGEAINRCPPGGDATIAALAELLDLPPLPLHGEARPQTVAFIREQECIGCTKCIQACPVDAIVGAPKLMHTVLADECTGCDLCVEPCPVDCIDMLPVAGQEAAPRAGESTQPCIRCGWCETACPVSLAPERLYHCALAGDGAGLAIHALDSCVECRACEIVCPSHITLVDFFQQAKTTLRRQRTTRDHARRYQARFEARNARLQRDAEAREQRRQRPQAVAAAPASSKQEAIRAAIARAKAKKAALQPPPTSH